MLTEVEISNASPSRKDAPATDDEGPRRARSSPIDQPQRYPYQPALDGVRAIAVAGVVLFHFGVGAVGGGFLGVDVFLALSGFLITTLLLREFGSSGRISIGAFYGRRARRLLPALFGLLIVIALFGHFYADQLQLVNLRLDTLASLFYVANWRFIVSGAGYFQQFASPSPVSHLWSLAIEEQWYLIWPLAVAGLLYLFGPPVRRQRRKWLLVTIGLAVVSSGLMALLVNDANVNRVYYGTDTRAQTLLIGAALAMLLHARSLPARAQRWLDAIGLVGLVGCIALFLAVGASDTWMYRGGFALAAVTATALIAGAAGPNEGWTRRVLSVPPLPELGRISYGVYLWHWPVVVFLDETRTGLTGPALFFVRLAVTLLVSIASYELIEQPIRHHRWPAPRAVRRTVVAVIAVAAVIVTATPVVANPDQQLSASQTVNSKDWALRPSESPADQRILVVGDSVGLSLTRGFERNITGRPAVIRTAARLGCALGPSRDPLCVHVFDTWKLAVAGFDPDVTVIVPGSWDLLPSLLPDRDSQGQPLKVRTAAYQDYLMQRLHDAFRDLTARGGRVALFTVPCYVYVVRSSPKLEDIAWLNGILRTAAAKAGPAVKVMDYGNYICPNGQNRPVISGVKMRYDGVHLTHEGGQSVWKWLAPQLPARKRS